MKPKNWLNNERTLAVIPEFLINVAIDHDKASLIEWRNDEYINFSTYIWNVLKHKKFIPKKFNIW